MISKAVLGGGCFWCIEAVLQRLKGVQKVQSGYAGGNTPNPTYSVVSSGQSSHAEVVRVHYNQQILPYRDLIYIFMMNHDPTTLNRQNHDVGPQYRSILLYESEQQLKTIQQIFKQAQNNYKDPIVTEVKKLDKFYPGEQQHQNYYNDNTNAGYCRAVIRPKIDKLQKLYSKYLQNPGYEKKEKTDKKCEVM